MPLILRATPEPKARGPIDWTALKVEIVSRLDVAAEFASLGVRFSRPSADSKGLRECHAFGRDDFSPSSFVNVRSGVYHDSGGEGESLHLFAFAARYGPHGRWIDAVRHYAGVVGVEIPSLSTRSGGRILEARYDYRNASGTPSYSVFRYVMPNGKKTFSQHPVDASGKVTRWESGCMDGVTPLPFRLPELLASSSDTPVWICEGEKAAEAVAGLGLVATTNHGGSKVTDKTWPHFLEHFRRRVVIVLPDNDATGRSHASKICGYLVGIALTVKLLELPGLPAKGDAFDWIAQGGTLEGLRRLADATPDWTPPLVAPIEALFHKNGNGTNGNISPLSINGTYHHGDGEPAREGPEDPHRLARTFLNRHCSHPDGLALRYWNEEWHRWDGKCWRTCPDREISSELTGLIKAEYDRLSRERNDTPKPVTTKAVGNTIQALRHLGLLSTRDVRRQPEWLGPLEPGRSQPDPIEILPASNGLVHLPSFADHQSCLIPPTPRFFSPNSLGYAFDPKAPEPRAWIGFLDSLWPDDPESIEALQEWFGYLLTPDTCQQKILMLIGPKRSGKGTIGRVLRALVGPDNVAAPTLSGVATNFGLAPLIGKPVALIADARLSGRADTQVIVERLLSISGEDAQTIDRKHLTSWTGSLPTRFVLISNELPRLGDSSGALPSRMILLSLTRSFYGHEDTTLSDRILAERPSILLWAIEGWRRLRERGRFLQPSSGRELLDELDELASPVSAFLSAACDVAAELDVEVKDLFEAWKKWCTENGRDHPGDVAGFGRSLRACLPGLKTIQIRRGESRIRVFRGLDLKPPDSLAVPF
jgi:putative DNA primase/helicase